jgi:ATP-dependent Clp protease adaptor protein ClpS
MKSIKYKNNENYQNFQSNQSITSSVYMPNQSSTYNPNEEEILLLEEEVKPGNQLILFNDDVNTFDWVIDTLVEICGHTKEQAEQCALLIHYKGKYAVKKDSYEKLKPQCDAINDRLINATIEVVA